ncbi:hypothetical protein [Cellulomonas composti]|uniref:hypothetical protein n=1 Tax=Cellulomonas composti TaxID=266130 RepID=UPI001649C029|nr:hypothetical protein [Cellulomonas composti]
MAIEALSDSRRQERWGRVEPGVNWFEDLTLDIHTLYDDSSCVGATELNRHD